MYFKNCSCDFYFSKNVIDLLLLTNIKILALYLLIYVKKIHKYDI